MHDAADEGGFDAVKVLIEHGADIHVTNNVSCYSLIALFIYTIIQECYVLVCRYITKHNISFSYVHQHILYETD